MSEQQININDVYREIGSVRGDVGELKGEIKQMNARLSEFTQNCTNHQSRTNKLESTVDQMVGKSGVIGALFGFIGAVIITIMSRPWK